MKYITPNGRISPIRIASLNLLCVGVVVSIDKHLVELGRHCIIQLHKPIMSEYDVPIALGMTARRAACSLGSPSAAANSAICIKRNNIDKKSRRGFSDIVLISVVKLPRKKQLLY